MLMPKDITSEEKTRRNTSKEGFTILRNNAFQVCVQPLSFVYYCAAFYSMAAAARHRKLTRPATPLTAFHEPGGKSPKQATGRPPADYAKSSIEGNVREILNTTVYDSLGVWREAGASDFHLTAC